MRIKPIVFLIEENNDTRPLLRELLKDYGYQVALAIDREDAIERVSHGAFAVDLIIVNLRDTAPEEMLNFADDLQVDLDSKVPIVAIASDFAAELEGTNKKISDDEYIVYLESGDQLFNLLELLLPESNENLGHTEI